MLSVSGMFNLSYATANGGWLGNYTIYALSFYIHTVPLLAANQTTFQTKVSYDVNGDGIVNMLDLYYVALHYGQTPSDPHWDSHADVDKNSVVNMMDLYLVAVNYGRWGRYP
jgi:hypothetical protein